ncbi:CHAT domain-containing tetratricopeptide repeat protein [Aquimarina sp. 2201CG5-10]|uniref:CHAT domain-containing protein n=1 Tax=Aquimarina callyspongiae TaxID=3098150 RepID=UPI002AB40542|nr:CHAT domain-containing tetratricopeptide repeat protein [Aquimarina sp. 2201CG5-10]MDY8135246.1 CHAT domain-containing tetratricopeptide repeat protein [Aquimarina sp. 2201CG5-10]
MKQFVQLVFLLLIVVFNGSAQVTNDTIIASQYFKKGELLLVNKKLDSAISYFKKALPLYEKTKSWEQVAGCYNRMSESEKYKAFYNESFVLAKKAMLISTKYFEKDNLEKANAYDNIGDYYRIKKSDLKTALNYYQNAFIIRKKTISKRPADIAISYTNLARLKMNKGQYDQAINLLNNALDIRLKYYGENHYKTAETYFLIARNYRHKWEFDKTLMYYKKVLKIRLSFFGKNHIQTARVYGNIGILYYVRGENDVALKYLKKELYLKNKVLRRNHPNLADTNLNIGAVYKEKGEFDNALVYIEKALKILKNHFGDNHVETSPVYFNLASIYAKTGKWNMALNYYNKIKDIIQTTNQSKEDFAIIYNKIGLIYTQMGNYPAAEKYLQNSIFLKEKIFGKNHIAIADSYNNLGTVYRLQKKRKEALSYYLRSLTIKQRKYKGNHKSIANSMKEIGALFIDEKRFEEAEEYLTKAFQIRKELYGVHHGVTKAVQNQIAYCHYKNKKLDLALSYYQSALQEDKKKQTLDRNFGVLLTSLIGKSQTYTSLFKETKKVKYLDSSKVTYQKAQQVINKTRHNLRHYKDKITFSKKVKQIYLGAIENQMLLYTQTNDTKFLNKAFVYSEQGKSNTLKEQLFYESSVQFAGLNPGLVKLEKKLKTDRSYYQSLIAKEQGKKTIDSVRITEIKNKLFNITRKRDSLTTVLEKNYPKYYQLKYQNEIVSIKKIQQNLKQNTTLLEFFTEDSITYAFTISKNDLDVIKLSTPKLQENITFLREKIISKNTKAYKTIAHSLYKQLILPLKGKIIGDEVIIIPDGPLWHLNFDLLISQDNLSKDPKEFSYLLKKYAITYANSATLLLNSFKADKSIKNLQECLAFSFSDDIGIEITDTNTIDLATLRDSDDDLPGTRKEIKAIADIIDGQYFYGSEANEGNFKKHVNQYNILHLALHGEVDNEYPENSKLYFTKSKDTLEDNLLYSHELFAMDIPSELTVLSACNTGSGKIAKGEGIMSLGNAFQYAGTKSLLLTSWEVSDATTPEIMKDFYTYLKDGKNKAKALQQAKLKYLETSELNRTHPFYWGGFYLVGDATPIEFKNSDSIWWIIGLGVLALVVLTMFWYKRKVNN